MEANMTGRQHIRSRRSFLKSAGMLAVASSLPLWYVDECLAQQSEATTSGKDLRLGLIGCGGRGTGDARNAAHYATIAAVCDVDARHVERAKESFPGAQGYSDFRELLERSDIDAVICGTVDHWHTLVAMAAMRAGKDIYCEKPLTLTIDEGKRLVQCQQETGRILQTGTQQRSSAYFRLACDCVRNERIGRLQKVEVWLPAGLRQGPFKVSPVPEGFNYDFWLGQTAEVPYVKERTHFSFRYWWEYSGGTMTDWGAHHNDIALWALNMDHSGPVSVEGKQLVKMIPGGFTAASEYEVTYTYANGVIHTSKSTTASEWNGRTLDAKGQLHGIKFTGTDGWLWVTRGAIDASDRQVFRERFSADSPRVYHSDNHMGNFIDCVKSRKAPICPVEVGHRSASISHLGVIAIRLGRKLNWDPVKEQFVRDAEANGMVSRPMRKPYDYTMV
ncbi:MAG: Gfo/Idh/MocA family oxidoreductase [Planctomycetes bacterium]|nr:Gfo/Idh/MocA family oxidoreductase [Planctomycetota bacterium]